MSAFAVAENMEEKLFDTINWLAVTVPFFAAWGAYSALQEKAFPKAIASIAGLAILAAIFGGYTLTYQYTGFPMWMRWFTIQTSASVFPTGIFKQASASEFPTGILKQTSFIVEKGPIRLTKSDVYYSDGFVNIIKTSASTYQFTTTASLQVSATTPRQADTRVDVFTVMWDTKNSGRLINGNAKFGNDSSTFIIENGALTIKSWIARTELWEMHVYSLDR
ncbi:MAG: hypothetical protein WAN43_03365 [Rhodomicrobium sp.]